jgi:hypothetical protein
VEKHPVLVRLYYDQYGDLTTIGEGTLVVTDIQSYVNARQAIDEVKAGEHPAPLSIIVRSPHYFSGFHDLALLGDLAHISTIAPRDELSRRLHIQIPAELTDRDLLALGIKTSDDLLAAANPQGITDRAALDDALLARAFGTQVFKVNEVSSFETWFGELVSFLYSDQAAGRSGWSVEYVQIVARERVELVLERFERTGLQPFVTDILERCPRGETRTYLNQLAVRYWLGSYPKLARKDVIGNLTSQAGQWQDVSGEKVVLDALAPWSEELYTQADNPLVEQLEQVLALLLREDDLLEDKDLSQYIAKMSGRFAAEHGAVQARIGRLLLEQRHTDSAKVDRAALQTYSAQIASRFALLSAKMGQALPGIGWIDSLLEYYDFMGHLEEATPSHWGDWLATYELLIRARRLKRAVEETVPHQYVEQVAGLTASFSALDERLNSMFADWLLEEYPALVVSSADQPPLALNAARMALDCLAKGHRIILLVVDALDWELWRYLRNALGTQGFVVRGDDAGLAVLPTITEFSRRAIFSGLTPRNLTNFVDDIYGTDIPPQEEAKTLARALGYLGRVDEMRPLPTNKRIRYLGRELVYANGSEKDFRQALELEARCYAFVYTEIDSLIHSSKSAETELRQTVQQWLDHLVTEILKGVRQNAALCNEANLDIIVASDHGFLDVSDQEQAEIEQSLRAYVDLERHGRLAIIRTKSGESGANLSSILQVAKSFYGQHGTAWHAIWREQSEQFGLAESSPSEGDVIAWLMPRLLDYVKRGKGNYVHGGLSMYEVIVPVALLNRGVLGFEAPVVTLSGQLSSEEESELTIVILNKTDVPLRGGIVSIPEMGLGKTPFGDIGPHEVKSLVVSVIPPKSGDIPVQVVLDGEIGGKRQEFKEQRVLTVQPGRRERIRVSTRRTFEEDDL